MDIQNILVTGANGQLGHFIREVVEKYKNVMGHYYFKGHDELDITNDESIEKAFDECQPDVVVNCAAYTNVNKAEEDSETASLVNKVGVIKLIKACKKHDASLIQISTDYVFDGIERRREIGQSHHKDFMVVFGIWEEFLYDHEEEDFGWGGMQGDK